MTALFSEVAMGNCSISREQSNSFWDGSSTMPGNDQETLSSSGTVLSRLIGEEKYEAALERAEEQPAEVETWILYGHDDNDWSSDSPLSQNVIRHHRRVSYPSMDPVNDTFPVRQLPLHMACERLSKRVSSTTTPQKIALENLIVTLISIYPDACSRRDRDGSLPFHQVIRSRPSIEVLVQLIAAYPDALKDEKGGALARSLMLWSSREQTDPYVKSVAEWVSKGKQALRQSRYETRLRFLLGVYSPGIKDFARGEKASSALLKSAVMPLGFPEMEQVSDQTTSSESDTERNNLRTIEDLLQNLLARNDACTSVPLKLSKKHITHPREVTNPVELQDEISDLKKRIMELEMILRDRGLDKDGNDFAEGMERGEMMSVMGMDPERPSPLTKYMESRIMELQEDFEELESDNERLAARLEELQSMLNNLERKHVENSLHSSDDVEESVRSKGLSASHSDHAIVVSSGVMNETPASTPENSDGESRDSEDEGKNTVDGRLDEYSDSLYNSIADTAEVKLTKANQENMKLLVENTRLAKENVGLKTALAEALVGQNPSEDHSVMTESHATELDDPTRRCGEISDTALDAESSMRQGISDPSQLLSKRINDNHFLRDDSNPPVDSLSLTSAFFQPGNQREMTDSLQSRGSKEQSLENKLTAVDIVSAYSKGEQGDQNIDDENISCSTPNHNTLEAVSMDEFSAVSSPQSLHGSEMIASRGNNSSSSRTASNRSATSWTVLCLTQQPAKRKGHRHRNLNALIDVSVESNTTESFHNSLDDLATSLFTDDLNLIFKTAAEFYQGYGSIDGEADNATKDPRDIEPSKLKPSKPLSTNTERGRKRRFSDGGASPLIRQRKVPLRYWNTPGTLQQASFLLAADEDLQEIVRRSEAILGYCFPDALALALQEATFHLTSIDRQPEDQTIPHKIIDDTLTKQAQEIYGQVVPEAMKLALRAASRALIETSTDRGGRMQKMKERLELEFLDTLVGIAESKISMALPVDLVDSLRTVSATFGQLLKESVDHNSSQDYSIQIDFQLLDQVFKRAQGMYGRRFPKEILIALREASFVLQSRLEGTDTEGRLETIPNTKRTAYNLRGGSAIGSFCGTNQNCDTRSRSPDQIKEGQSFIVEKTGKNFGRKMLKLKKHPNRPSTEKETGLQTKLSSGFESLSCHLPNKAAVDRSFAHMKRKDDHENDKFKSAERLGSDKSIDVMDAFERDISVYLDGKQTTPQEEKRIPDSHMKKGQKEQFSSMGNGDDANFIRGRSPTRQNDPLHRSFNNESIVSPTKKAAKRRPRSADPKLDEIGSARFGTDDLDVIFKQAANVVGASSSSSDLYSNGPSSSSDPFFPSTVKEAYKSVDEVLDSLVADTEETYGIEIADGVVWALKRAIQQSVYDPTLLPVVRALHDNDVIEQASIFNEGKIPDDLIQAIRSTSLPPGVSVESLITKNKEEIKESTQNSRSKSDNRNESPERTATTSVQKVNALYIQPLDENTIHSDTSWGKLSLATAKRFAESDGAAKESGTKGLSTNLILSQRERKREAERKLTSRVAGFSGSPKELQDLFSHAKETLEMYSPATVNRKRMQAEESKSKRRESDKDSHHVKATESIAMKRHKANGIFPSSPRNLELDSLLSALEEDSFELDSESKPNKTLEMASKCRDKSIETNKTRHEENGVSFGTCISTGIDEAGGVVEESLALETLPKRDVTFHRMRTAQEGELCSEAPPIEKQMDDLGEMFKAVYNQSPRVDPSSKPPGPLQPPAPPDFVALAAERSRRRSFESFEPQKRSLSSDESNAIPNISDSLVSMAMDTDDDLVKLYKSAYRVEKHDNEYAPSSSERSPPVPKFESFKPGYRALSAGDLKSPPLERRTPILSKFLELNRQDQLERTHSGREIPMVSPVTEPTMESRSITEDAKARLFALAQTMPNLPTDSEENGQHGSLEIEEQIVRDDQTSSRDTRIEEASFDTFQELEAILTETKREYGTELSVDLVSAIKKAAVSSDLDPDSLHDSVSLIMEQIAVGSDVASNDVSSLHGIAMEIGKKLSSTEASETSKSLAELIVSLSNRLGGSQHRDEEVKPTVRASKHYLDKLVLTAESDLGFLLPSEVTNKIRTSTVEADMQQNPPVSWEDLESLLHDVCQEQDEDAWFEIQEAFFRAWDKSKRQDFGSKASTWGLGSGYFSSVSESAVSILMDDQNRLEDIADEVKRLHGGEVPEEVVDRLKRSLSVVDFSEQFGDSSKSSSFFKESAQSVNFDYSQSTFSSFTTNMTSPVPSSKPGVQGLRNLEGLDLIQEAGSQSQSTGSSIGRKNEVPESQNDKPGKEPGSPIRARSKSNSTISSLSNTGETDRTDDKNSVKLKSSNDHSTDDSSNSVPLAFVVSSTRPAVERAHSSQSAHSVTVNKTSGTDILREIEKKFGSNIPRELVLVLKQSVAIPYSMNSDEDISIILREFEGVCQKTLPADLVLALREASVSLRSMSTSSRSRRSRLIRQSSGSFRSTSRSSSMPSISETGGVFVGAREISQPVIVPGEVKTHHPNRALPMMERAVSRKDSADPGLPSTGFETQGGFSGASVDRSTHSSVCSEESMTIESVHQDIGTVHELPSVSPRTRFNESEATQLATNIQEARVKETGLPLELGTVHSCTPSMDSTIEEFAELNAIDCSAQSYTQALDNSDSVSSLGTTVHTLSQDDRGGTSHSTENISTVSRTSTLPSRRLPIGVDMSPPVEGVESDDLNVIFAAAARRMSQ